jgi:hypothetical protein
MLRRLSRADEVERTANCGNEVEGVITMTGAGRFHSHLEIFGLLAVIAILSAGCEHNSGEDGVDPETEGPWHSIFDTDAWDVAVEPDCYAPGDTATVIVRCVGLFDGTGSIKLHGLGGGSAVGRLLEPVTGEVGRQVIYTEFLANIPLEWRFPVEITSTLSTPQIEVTAVYDSVVVAGALRDVSSQEGSQLIGGGAVTYIGGLVVLNNQEVAK